ncbi:MAG TPA: NAD(P)-binding domain-containing protein [Firmicutes bacterium]|nr:NAD(P)-binding domain-containing protein [Bacillota bacterium]
MVERKKRKIPEKEENKKEVRNLAQEGFKRVAILGAGNGAHAFAAHLGMLGKEVNIYNKFPEELAAIKEKGAVEVEGVLEGVGPVNKVTTDIAEAVAGAEIILVVVPAFVHRFMAQALAPHLVDGQIITIHPGRTGGVLEFAQVLKESGLKADVKIAEAQTLLYACRISGPARVAVKGLKKEVAVAAFPARDTQAVLDRLCPVLPQFKAAANVLVTSLDNIGAIFHPTTVLLNTGRIESKIPFKFYVDGMTETVTKALAKVDSERVAIARALGIEMESAAQWLRRVYGSEGENLHQLLHNTKAYWDIAAPTSMQVRYVLEDIPTGLVPFASLGESLGVPTPACRAMVDLACILYDRDFWAEGRTVANLGLAGLNREEMLHFVTEGFRG